MYFQVYFSPGTTDISTLPKQVKGDLQVRAQGEDKPSPLLWTKWLGRLLRRHSRGDGLSSPCALTCKSPLTCFGSVEISVVPGEKYTCKYICFLYFSLPYPVLSKAEISLTASAKTTIISLKSFNTYIDNHRINGTFSTVCERVV